MFMVPQSSTAGQGMPDQGRKRAHLGPGAPAKRCAPIRPFVLPVMDGARQESLEPRSSVGDERGPAKLIDGHY